MSTRILLPALFATALAGACGDDETTSTTLVPTSATQTTASTGASGGAGGTSTSSGGGGSTSQGGGGSGGAAPFALTSSAFMEGDTIPTQHQCDNGGDGCMGAHVSPALSWTPGPAGTQSYAIVMRDLDYMNGFVHWVIWDIPANVTSLPEGLDSAPMPADVPGASQSSQGYRGPCSCGAAAINTYEFTIYALDVANVPNVSAGDSRPDAEAAVTALTPLATATLSGES